MAVQNGYRINNSRTPIEIGVHVKESQCERYAKITFLVVTILIAIALVIILSLRLYLK
jgi:hypothetical protein